MTNCTCHDVPLADCPSIQESPALSIMVNSTFMHELNEGHGATVDARMVPLIKFLNRLNVTTLSSRYDTEFCNVMFTSSDPMLMAQLMFVHLKAFASAMPEGVYLEMSYDQMMGFVGIVEIPTELLDEFSNRVGIWLEMLHK
jgi:hypothetical protein